MTHKTRHTAGNRGWIKLHRSLLSREWYSNFNVTRLFIHLLLKAGRETTRWQGHELPRGSFVTSLTTLSLETGLSVKAVRTALYHLTSSGDITIQATNRFRIVTLCNYDFYQTQTTDEGQTQGKQNGKQTGRQEADQGASQRQSQMTDNMDNYPTAQNIDGKQRDDIGASNEAGSTATIQEYNKKEKRKKNNNNLSLTHACEERNLNFDLNLFLDQYFSRERESMVQGVATSLGFKDSVEMRKAAAAIVGEWRASETGHRDFQDAASHLQSLLRLRRDEREREKRRAAAGSRYGSGGSHRNRAYSEASLHVNDRWINNSKFKPPVA